MKKQKKVLAIILALVMAIGFMSCGTQKEDIISDETEYEFVQVYENGSTEFYFGVVDLDGHELYFDVKTDKETVGEALLEIGLIDGDESEYGLYVKTVNGTTLDYEKDGKYWAFYVNNEYAVSGVDTTEIESKTLYEFKAE